MITKPSIHELIQGTVRNMEGVAQSGEAGNVLSLVTPLLSVLDRIANEWPSWVALMAADNADIRHTLRDLGMTVPAAEADVSPLLASRAAMPAER